MKLTPQKLVEMMATAARAAIVEAKKKGKKPSPKKKKPVEGVTDVPPGYQHSQVLDYAKPQGRRSIVKAAGAANFGPYTGESLLRKLVSDVIREQLAPQKIRGRR